MSKTVSSRKSTNAFKIAIIRHLREWHRKLGIFAAFFLIFLSLSGIALNHTESLNLGHYSIKNQWLLNHYGINPPQDIRFFENNQASVTDKLVWLNETLLVESEEPIIAVSKFQSFWLVTTANSLSIYDNSAQLVDQMDTNTGLPENISAVSISDNFITLNTANGYFQTDENLLDWTSI